MQKPVPLADPLCCLRDPLGSIKTPKCGMLEEKGRLNETMSGKGDMLREEKSYSCGGMSIREMIEAELDAVMERLMTDTEAEDGRDKGRAEGFAMALAIIKNPYFPNINVIRAETLDRYNERNGDD